MKNVAELKGPQLAVELMKVYPLALENPGKVFAHYVGGGWLHISGNGLKPHPDMAARYPNGWSLFDRMKCSSARAMLAADQFRAFTDGRAVVA